jgi:hypothetical protein
MSPFFKPEPRRSLCFEYYKNTIYTVLSALALAALITIPWLIDLTRDILTESMPRRSPPPSEAWVLSTVAVIMVMYAVLIAIGAFTIYSESFRFAMAYGTVAIFSPLTLVTYWRYVYPVAIMAILLLLGALFCTYAIVVIRFEAAAKRRLDAVARGRHAKIEQF